MNAPISVVIPCYNAGPWLAEALDSVVRQTLSPWEVLVVDDGSTDDSREVADRFAPMVRVMRQENRGEAAARNRGLDAAAGDWTALLDADDRWEPEHLWRLAEAAETAAGDVVCVYSDVYHFGEGVAPRIDRFADHHAGEDYHVKMLTHATVAANSCLVRTDVARQVRFPEGIHDGPDMIFFLELRDRGRFVHVPQATAGYRIRPGQVSRSPGHVIRHTQNAWRWFVAHGRRFADGQRRQLFRDLAWKLPSAESAAEYLRWLDGEEHPIDRQAIDLMRERLECRKAYLQAVQSHRRRQWDVFLPLREWLARHAADDPDVRRLLSIRVYPRWLYPIWDRYKALRAG